MEYLLDFSTIIKSKLITNNGAYYSDNIMN